MSYWILASSMVHYIRKAKEEMKLDANIVN